MNFLEIISAHVRWKQRLLDYIADSSEKLDPALVGADDHCKLGKWIYGEGQAYAGLPHFEKVRAEHANFHKHAAAVVTFVNLGDHATAQQVLKLVEMLEDHDDVNNVFANFDIPDQLLEALL